MRVVPSKGLDSYAAETVKKMVERLGHKKIIMNEERQRAGDSGIEGGSEERE